jgi:hypothetical protein
MGTDFLPDISIPALHTQSHVCHGYKEMEHKTMWCRWRVYSVQHKVLCTRVTRGYGDSCDTHTTVGAEEDHVARNGSHPSNLAGLHRPVADQRGRLWLPRARTSNQAKQSSRAAPIPPPTPKMPRPLVPLVSAGACAPPRGRLGPWQAGGGGRRVRVRASAGAGEGTAPPRPSRTQVTVVLPSGFTDSHHVSARRRW